MASEGILQFSVASVVGDVLQQHGKKLNAIDLESRKANEDCMTKLSFLYKYVHFFYRIQFIIEKLFEVILMASFLYIFPIFYLKFVYIDYVECRGR